MAVKTGDLRAPGGRATTVKMFTGSRQEPRTTTSALPPAAVDSAARAMQPARSGGVWVNSATAATWSATQPGRTSTGNGGS